MGVTLSFSFIKDESFEKNEGNIEKINEYLSKDDKELFFGEKASLDIDKTWDGLHYLFTQGKGMSVFPFDFLKVGGIELYKSEFGFNQRYFDSKEVKAITQELRKISEAELESRFDPNEMMKLKIYPTIWDRDRKVDDTYGYLEEHFINLKCLFTFASKYDLGTVISLG